VIDWEASLNPRPVTLALLTADDPFSLETSKGTADYAVTRGQQIVYFQQYPNGSTNLYDLVQQAKAKSPDLLVNIGHLLEAIAVAKAARDLRLDAKVAVYANADAPEFVQALGSAAEYAVTGSPWTSQARYKASYYLSGPEYVAAYRKKFRVARDPDFAAAGGTAAGLVLQAAIERAQSLEPDRVRDSLASLDLSTFYGELRFDAQHQATEKRLLVEQVQNGRMLTVAPSELAASPAIYPAPNWTARLGLPPPSPPPAKLPGTGSPSKKPGNELG
jgi:branched-chain amino acid transport system substrate-binding protein